MKHSYKLRICGVLMATASLTFTVETFAISPRARIADRAAPPATATTMTFRKARRVIERASPVDFTMDAIQFRLINDTDGIQLSVNYRAKHDRDYSFSLKNMDRIDCIKSVYRPNYPLSGHMLVELWSVNPRTRKTQGVLKLYWLDAVAQPSAQEFAGALEWLISHGADSQPDPTAAEHFKAQADEWRSATTKPTMPEEAREHKVLAENAVQEKDFDKAIDEYEAALKIFPTWPEGQFNAALLCGETGDYDCAVEHMQDYLELVPDAPDAQAAKDKLIIWKDKIAHSQ